MSSRVENEVLMIQVKIIIVWADLEANMILMWSFVLMKIMLLICRLLVWFMSLEEKKCVIDISLDLEGFKSPYVLDRVVLENFVDCWKCYGSMFEWFWIDYIS